MTKDKALMAAESLEAPEVLRRQAEELDRPIAELAARLRRAPPRVVVTCARGSSGHAASFGKHLIERYLGVPVAAAAPSVATVYGQELRLDGQLFLAISQSGRSDDLIESASLAKRSGALTVAVVNDPGGPLASFCDVVLPMSAGPEISVAATKTFIASVAILLRLTAEWAEKQEIMAALHRLPERLLEASKLDWTRALPTLATATRLAILGRGPTFAIAREASLKLKETCDIQAEAFSGADFQHGPMALASAGYPVLVFMPTDGAASELGKLAADLCRKGASVFVTGEDVAMGERFPVVARDFPETDAVCLIQSFYGLIVRLAEHRGLNADQPRHLKKVTRTK